METNAVGKFLARGLPTSMFLVGSRFESKLSPGDFTMKEHMVSH